MKTVGFVISAKEDELRRALLPPDIAHIRNVTYLYFEENYGKMIGYTDDDYKSMGVNVVSRKEAFKQDIICCVKTPKPSEHQFFSRGQTLFGWIHAVQVRETTDFLLDKKITGIAWEEMFESGRHVFWRNNEIAGEAGVLHSFLFYGRAPYECSVAVIGRGNCARGAIRILEKLGAKVTVYDKKTVQILRKEIETYDVIVNTVLWDVFRKDRLIYREDLTRMKKGAMIVDISCDSAMEIETSRATTIKQPTYFIDGIIHYGVDHTASLFWKMATESISREVNKYIDELVEGNNNAVLESATIIKNGKILDQKITRFQGR